MKNKLISVLTILVMCFSIMSIGAHAEPVEVISDQSEYTLLEDLGFITDAFGSEYSTSKQMTRAQFASLVAGLCGLSGQSASLEDADRFTDVSPANPHYNAINLVAKYGYMNGVGSNLFMPDENVELGHVLKVFVSLLGYDSLAAVKGGYPSGYVAVASNLGLTDGVTIGDKLRGDAVIKIAYNMLHTKVYVVRSISSSSVVMTTDENRSFLKEYHDIDVIWGQIRGVSGIIASDTDPVGEDEIIIDDTVFKADKEKSYSDYFGYMVNAYKDSSNKIVAISTLPHGSRKITLAFDDIAKLSFDSVEYYDGDKLKKVTTNAETDFVYNGKTPCPSNISDVLSKDGNIELIFADSDNAVDCISITVADTYVVKKIDPNTLTVYDMYSSKKICLEDYDDFTIVNSFGTQMDPAELGAYDVISVIESADKSLLKIYCSNSEVEGVISQTDSAGGTYTIGNKAFGVSNSFAGASSVLKIGKSGIFVLDIYGKIAGFKSYSDAYTFGYIINYVVTSGLDAKAYVRLLAESGKIEVIPVAKKLLYNGVANDGLTLVQSLKESKGNKGELVRYRTTNGTLSAIDTALEDQKCDDDSLTTLFTGFDDSGRGVTSLMYNSYQHILGSKLALQSGAKAFYVPTQYSADEKDYTVKTASFTHDDVYYVNAYAHSKDSLCASVVLIYGGASSEIGVKSPFFVVDSVSKALNSDGDEITKIHGFMRDPYKKGDYGELLVKDETLLSTLPSISDPEKMHTLSCGDIIKYGTDTEGYVNTITIYYDYAGDKTLENITVGTTLTRGVRTVRARVYSESDGVIMVTQNSLDRQGVEIGFNERELLKPDLYDIFILNNDKKGETRLEKTTSAAIVDYVSSGGEYSEILICSAYNNPGIIIIRK